MLTMGGHPGTSAARRPALLEELADVLGRACPTKPLAVIGRSAREMLADHIAVIEIALPIDVRRVVPNDADDDHVIAAAVAAHATLIVSGDSHLLTIGGLQGIDISSAAMAVEQIGIEGARNKI